MTPDRIESQIETLTDEQRERFEQRLEEREPELREELLENHRADIKNQLINDREELNNFNIIVSGFQNRDETEYKFIRTEPFIHKNRPNFDLLIAAPEKGNALLIEYERSLASETDDNVKRFGERKEFVESGGDDVLDVDTYLSEVLNPHIDEFDFVLSSQHTPQDRLEGAAERKDLSYCVWSLADHGVRCSITYFTVKKDKKDPFKGHSDDELEDFIHNILSSKVFKHDHLGFTSSSSNYRKVKHMAMILVSRYHNKGNETFTYSDWEHLFGEEDMELNNYLREEKESMYKKFLQYGQEWNIVAKEIDRGDKLKNGYRIKSSATTDMEKLSDELEMKMAEVRMGDDFDEELVSLKENILEDIQSGDRTTLWDFTD
jgi:hypothetical protein